MADIQRPEENPHYRIVETQRLGKDKKPDDGENGRKKERPPFVFITLVLDFLQKISNLFLKKSKRQKEIVDKKQVIKDLKQLKALFQDLKNRDISHRSDFVEILAHTWVRLVDDWRCFKLFQRENPLEYTQLRQLIEMIRSYPSNTDHTIGYYLHKHVGEKWFPYPFMEILEQLHEENQFNKQDSHLSIWVNTIDELLSLLEIKPVKEEDPD
jgi:CRISPR/Cas system CSM-associated protein Csm2 small subunit